MVNPWYLPFQDAASDVNIMVEGGAVAEWYKALQLGEKINENQKIPGSPPGMGNL